MLIARAVALISHELRGPGEALQRDLRLNARRLDLSLSSPFLSAVANANVAAKTHSRPLARSLFRSLGVRGWLRRHRLPHHPQQGDLSARSDERIRGYAPTFAFRLHSELIAREAFNADDTSLVPASAGPRRCGSAGPSERDDRVRRERPRDSFGSMLSEDVSW
jgi:hypothetical protein